MATLVLVAYPPDDPLGTPAGTLANAYETSVTVEDDGIGAGSFALHPDDADAAWCVQDGYVAAYRDVVAGDPLAGFWIDALTEVVLSPDEGGGRELRVAGQGPIAILEEALVWPRAVSGGDGVVQRSKGRWRWKDAHPARVLVRLLEEATERGCLPGVSWDFSRDEDSDGEAWSSEAAQRFTAPIGASLLDVVRELRETGLHLTMTPGLVLRAWETSGRDLTESVAFTDGVDIRETAESTAAARRGRSHVVVEGEDAREALRYRVVRDPDIAAALGRRKEGFFRYTRTATPAVLERVGRRKLRRWQRLHDGPFVLPVVDTPGQIALVDYTAGDTVTVPTAFAASGAERIAAISLTEGEDGSYEVTLEFGDVAPDASSGRSYGGDTAGQDCCGGAGGAGDKPGSGGGGGTTTVVDIAGTEPLTLTDFECEGSGDLVVIATASGVSHHYVEGDTTASITLPAGWDEVPGRYLLVLVHEAADSNVRAEMEAEGFTKGIATVGSDLFFRRLDGTESWLGDEISLFFSGESVELAAVTLLVSGIYEELPSNPGLWDVASSSLTADPDDVPAPSWAGEPGIAITTCRTDGSAITAGPAGYSEAGTDTGTAIGLRVDYRLLDAAAEDPEAYTASGVEQTYTYLLRGGGCDPWRLPLQADTAAWWPGGNPWGVGGGDGATGHDAYGIVDGVFFFESSTPDAVYTFTVLPADGELPMEAASWELLIRYRLTTAAIPSDPGERYAAFSWAGSDSLILYFGDDTLPLLAEGIAVTGDGIDKLDRSLPVDGWALVRWRYDGSTMRARVWAEAEDEPVTWDVENAVGTDPDPDTYGFRMYGRLGNGGGPAQRLEIDAIGVVPVAGSGATVARVVPHGTGGIVDLGEAYEPGTLRISVDRGSVTPVSSDPAAGTADLGFAVYHDPARHPVGCAEVRVTYEVA